MRPLSFPRLAGGRVCFWILRESGATAAASAALLLDVWLHIHCAPHSILKLSNPRAQAVAQVG
jgi:hypothetical protein